MNGVQADRRGRRNLHIGDRGPGNDGPVRRRIEPRRLGNQCLIDASNGRYSLKRVLVDTGFELIETCAPLGHKFLIVKPLIEDHLQPAQAHGRIGARAQSQVHISHLSLL